MLDTDKVEEIEQKLEQQDHQLKGAFVSVMIVGGFIIGCWLFVFILFLMRNGG